MDLQVVIESPVVGKNGKKSVPDDDNENQNGEPRVVASYYQAAVFFGSLIGDLQEKTESLKKVFEDVQGLKSEMAAFTEATDQANSMLNDVQRTAQDFRAEILEKIEKITETFEYERSQREVLAGILTDVSDSVVVARQSELNWCIRSAENVRDNIQRNQQSILEKKNEIGELQVELDRLTEKCLPEEEAVVDEYSANILVAQRNKKRMLEAASRLRKSDDNSKRRRKSARIACC